MSVIFSQHHTCTCQMASKTVERFKQGGQTDQATEKRVKVSAGMATAKVLLELVANPMLCIKYIIL